MDVHMYEEKLRIHSGCTIHEMWACVCACICTFDIIIAAWTYENK